MRFEKHDKYTYLVEHGLKIVGGKEGAINSFLAYYIVLDFDQISEMIEKIIKSDEVSGSESITFHRNLFDAENKIYQNMVGNNKNEEADAYALKCARDVRLAI